MNLPEFGVKRPVTNLMIFSSIIIIAVYSLTRLGIDMMPKIEPPSITVVTSYPGASPEDVEIRVTEPLENQLATTPGIEKLTSRSIEGASLITLKFIWGTNLDEASNDIRDRIELAKRVLPDIPDEIDNPFIVKFNTASIPILFLGITADQSYPDLYDLIDERVGDSLRQLPGVGTVQIYGGLQRQINVWIDRERLEGYGFSILDIRNALREENVTQPLGSIKSGLTEYLLRLPGEFATPDEINLVILGKRANKIVYLKDVARVEDSFKEVMMKVRINRRPGIMMAIQKQTGTNTVEVAERIKARVRKLEGTLPSD
ncbi:MAG: efflux RND transporter permease subunit, partial [Candidatus Omnitrophica bacterium]|nr:efflux RND transporter permease subunit [Candidatus Omnitrophota bacterium]